MHGRTIEVVLAKAALGRPGFSEQISQIGAFSRNPDERAFRKIILELLSDLFKLPEIDSTAKELEQRLRVALHLSPPEAIKYDRHRPEPRWMLVKAYIDANFQFPSEETEAIARMVASVLDDWEAKRKFGTTGYRGQLLRKQHYRCACCHLDFRDATRIECEEERIFLGTVDPFKPYFDGQGVRDSMRPEVDHVAVISKDGTNSSDNLQILCALCNQGKGDGSGINISKELEYCALPVHQIPRSHRMNLFYYRLTLDRFSCSICKSTENELSVRLLRIGGAVTLTNLYSICYQCLHSLTGVDLIESTCP
jgi:5-methylcytosine-specific restriction endonuclease McrA